MLISFEKANKIVAHRDPQSGANAYARVQAGGDSRTRSRVLPAVLCATSARNNCWRALARKQSIIYNSEKKPKFVGCQIGHEAQSIVFFISGHSGVLVNIRGIEP